MALAQGQFLNSSGGQPPTLMGMSQGINVLGQALSSAVDAGRRMVDLQSHQEDQFLSQAENLRRMNERKRNESRRMFESDRTFDESVTRDRRNFGESVFQDRRDFDLMSEMQRGRLGMEGTRLGLAVKADARAERKLQSSIGVDKARSQYYLNGGSRRGGAADGGSDIGTYLNDYAAAQRGMKGTELNVTLEPGQTMSPADQELLLQNTERRKGYQSTIDMASRLFTQPDVARNWDSLTPEQKATAAQLDLPQGRYKPGTATVFDPASFDTGAGLGVGFGE